MKINDGRIGSLDKKGMVEKNPTHYATGGFWNKSANATPSTCYFGKDNNYFFVLPINVPTISEKLWDEFYGLIEEERPVVAEPEHEAKVYERKIEEDVIVGASASDPSIIKPKGNKNKKAHHMAKVEDLFVEKGFEEDEGMSRPEDDDTESDE